MTRKILGVVMYDYDAIAHELDISRHTVVNLVAQKKLKPTRLGDRNYISENQLLTYLKNENHEN